MEEKKVSAIPVRHYTLALVAKYTLDHGSLDSFPAFMKEFVDARSHPYNRSPERQRVMIEDEPPLLPDPMYNVFLAGAAETIALEEGIEPPAWIEKPERFLPEPLIAGGSPESQACAIEATPEPFRRRNFFCGTPTLWTNRWNMRYLELYGKLPR